MDIGYKPIARERISSSKRIHCPCCLEKCHRDGSTTYHHNMLCAALVHDQKHEVFIMGSESEAIIRQDGRQKNGYSYITTVKPAL